MCTHNVAETVNFIVVALCTGSHNSELKSATWVHGVSLFVYDPTSKGWPVLFHGFCWAKDAQGLLTLPGSSCLPPLLG